MFGSSDQQLVDDDSSILGDRCGSVSNGCTSHATSNSYSTTKVVGLMAAAEIAVALEAMCKFTLRLLSACAPEALRPFAAHNLQAIMNKDFHRVVLPSLEEVETIVRNRNSSASRRNDPVFLCGAPDADRQAADVASDVPFQTVQRDWTVDCDLYIEPEWSDPPTEESSSSSSSCSSSPSSISAFL